MFQKRLGMHIGKLKENIAYCIHVQFFVFLLTAAVFDKFGGEKEQNEQLWTKLTININDKIRGLKNGKYKKQ